MARGRMISRSLGSSKRFKALEDHAGELAEFASALFCLVIANSDDFGRLEGDAETIQWRCWPASGRSTAEFDLALKALHQSGLILWYQVEGQHFVEVKQFALHQSGLHKRTRSKFPDPPGYSAEDASSTNHLQATSGLTDRACQAMEFYSQQYLKVQKQPYLQSRLQQERDIEAARQLCMAYTDINVERIMVAFLKIKESHPKAKLLKGSRRTLPMLLTMADPIATQLKIKGVPNA